MASWCAGADTSERKHAAGSVACAVRTMRSPCRVTCAWRTPRLSRVAVVRMASVRTTKVVRIVRLSCCARAACARGAHTCAWRTLRLSCVAVVRMPSGRTINRIRIVRLSGSARAACTESVFSLPCPLRAPCARRLWPRMRSRHTTTARAHGARYSVRRTLRRRRLRSTRRGGGPLRRPAKAQAREHGFEIRLRIAYQRACPCDSQQPAAAAGH